MSRTQAEVFAFLKSPAAWPGKPRSVETIETHGAVVFLAGGDVLKIKRAVKLPYLDFSTLDARRHFCQREIALNGGAAAGIYRDCLPITREASGALAIAGQGQPVEWAVRMHRFAQDALLSNVVARGELSNARAETLADAVFAYHRAAPAIVGKDDHMAATAAGVLTSLARFQDGRIDEPRQRLAPLIEAQLARSAAIRKSRAEAGHVRRCHGDLHLANIVLWRERPVLFDALEFDEALATIDTLYDLAFLIMDLDRHSARVQANTILNRYLWRSGDIRDLQGLAALPLYLGLRASIRALVALHRAEAGAEGRDAAHAHARETLEAAITDLTPPPAALIAVGGLSGTGKTTLAHSLAPTLGAAPGALVLRSDLERKALSQVEPTDRLPPSAYTPSFAQAVYARVIDRAEAALKAGHSVILDAVFAKEEERRGAEALAARLGVAFQGLWLEGAAGMLKARVAGRVADASDATPEIVEKQFGYETGPITWARIDASDTPDKTLAAARAMLKI
jgi:aminoglycoside phosphotransferase family enzyme/predicted kinase